MQSLQPCEQDVALMHFLIVSVNENNANNANKLRYENCCSRYDRVRMQIH